MHVLSYPLQSAGSDDSLILLWVELFSKQDVAADRPRIDPGLLGSVRQLTSDLQHPLFIRQLPQDGAQQGGLGKGADTNAGQTG